MALALRKEYIFKTLSKIMDAVSGNVNFEFAEANLMTVQGVESQFRGLVNEIFAYNASLEDQKDAVYIGDLETFEVLIVGIRKRCIQVMNKKQSAVQLPKINLPTFTGDLKDWEHFIEQYNALIHSQPCTDIEKFTYLRSVLAKEPLAIVNQFEPIQENYKLAYDSLIARYDNPRLQAAYNIKRIFSYPKNEKGTFSKFLETHMAATASLKRMRVPDLADYVLFELCYKNLSTEHQKKFDCLNHFEIPTLDDLFNYVEGLARAEELQEQGAGPKQEKGAQEKGKQRSKSLGVFQTMTCECCNDKHRIYQCNKFKTEPVQKRMDIVTKSKLCVQCLGRHTTPCNSKYSCRRCQSSQHHTLLCPNDESTKTTCASCTTGKQWMGVVLSTARVLARDQWGKELEVRIILDPGSQVNLITEACVRRLGLRRFASPVNVEGVDRKETRSNGAVDLNLTSCKNPAIKYKCQAVVLPTICSDMPSSNLDADLVRHIESLDIPLADPKFYVRDRVDILLGGGAYMDWLTDEAPSVIKFQDGIPGAIRTKFGFIILGHAKPSTSCLFMKVDPVDVTLRQFWQMEEVETQKHEDPEAVQCETHFLETHERCEDGKYRVRLPFRSNVPPIGNNRVAAKNCFLRLEKRLCKNPELAGAYSDVIDDYVKQGHLRKAEKSSVYLLPHHCVLKDSSTTKVRVVFDASFKDEEQLSLNDRLLTGPALHNDLPDILFSFRLHDVAFSADIRQMYRMIWMHPDDQQYQHILWRNEKGEIDEYSLTTVTFGLTSSPWLAQRVLRQLLYDEGSGNVAACNAVRNQTFMDDITCGATTVEEAIQLRRDLSCLLKKGGFDLRKWACNKKEVLEELPDEEKEKMVNFRNQKGLKILGLFWDPTEDAFLYEVTAFEDARVTKRSVLSYIAKIWDCMGLLAAVIVKAKIFLQRLWLEKREWDEDLSPELCKEWKRFCEEMPGLSSIRIPRKISVASAVQIRLVGFSDASEKAMAANVYVHLLYKDGRSESHLVRCKTKVSPVKTVTIPRLELCAAWLLAKTMKSILDCKSIKVDSVEMFTDSQLVLYWLTIPPYKLKIFVANRVQQILELVPEARWHFIPGRDNPADLGSRGINASELIDNELWWKGPRLLTRPSSEWHNFTKSCKNIDRSTEMKREVTTLAVQSIPKFEFLMKFSSLKKMERVGAWILRFVYNLDPKNRVKRGGPLSVDELRIALRMCVRLTQEEYLNHVFLALRSGKKLPKSVRSFNPMLSEDGLIMVGGRLRNADLPETARQPLLVPKTSHLARQLAKYYHEKMLHSGPRTSWSALIQEFWIPQGFQLMKKLTRECMICFKLHAKPVQPFMGDLPAARVNVSRPFESTAVDFAGPIMTKESTRKRSPQHKSYICAFVCLSTKAVHLELVSELSTAAFLAALVRFSSHYSVPTTVYSDNGRNFVGAARQLHEATRFLIKNEEEIFSSMASHGVRWLFQPAYAPNFNGLVEAVVKSSKRLIVRQIGKDVLTFEEMMTLLARVKAVLNSRPLVPLDTDPNEAPNFLTPAHFLLGSAIRSPPELPAEELNLRSRWERVQRLSQLFWNRWRQEYLHTLQQRIKWAERSPNIDKNQLVYVKDLNCAPCDWPLGKVMELRPGKDGITRVAVVRCKGKDVIRAVNKLIRLPFPPVDDEE